MSSGTSYGGGGIGSLISDFAGAQKTAKHHSGGSGSDDMFGNALSMIHGKQSQLQDENVNEHHMVKKHKQYYGGEGDGGAATSSGMGSAAAMEALKMYTGGSSSGGSSNDFVGMAMGKAAQLYGEFCCRLG